MNLIPDFELDSLCRTVWVSAKAKEAWGQPIRDCANLVSELELLSVSEGQRKCGWQSINIQQLPSFERRCAEIGLATLAVKYSAPFEGFAHKFQPAGDINNNTNVPVIFAARLQDALNYRNAYEAGNHEAQGEFLGFPDCCRRFFDWVWPRYYDPIAQIKDKDKCHPYSNPLLRYIGLRVSFHIPCSFHCDKTIELAMQRMRLAREINADMATLLEALLSMPMSWDCLHGIAIIRTPIFYVIINSVPSIDRQIVKLNGKFIPKESARGICFPFKRD